MKVKTLPEVFEQFGEARQQGFLNIKALKEQGKNIVGIFCTYTPVEIFMAAGSIHVGLCSTSDETIPDAERELPRNLCPLIKSSYGFAITDKCPYMYFSDLIVGENTCDGKKKMYELLGKIKNVHVMDLPQRQDGELPFTLWREEIIRLKDRVEQEFGCTISDDALREAIKKRNMERKLLKELYELSILTPPPMNGLELLNVLFGIQFKFDWQEKLNELSTLIQDIKADYEQGLRPIPADRKRILITGCPMGGVTDKVVRIIEECGGVVVAFENCQGAKHLDRLCPEEGNPYHNLAHHYLEIGCSVMSPNNRRLEMLERMCKQYQVDGVVEMTLQACHTYAIETEIIRNFISERNIPYLHLETNYSTQDISQLRTRAGAFLEMI